MIELLIEATEFVGRSFSVWLLDGLAIEEHEDSVFEEIDGLFTVRMIELSSGEGGLLVWGQSEGEEVGVVLEEEAADL